MGSLQRTIEDIIGDPAMFVIRALLLVVAISLHEWGHAIMATMCGDPTPKMDGRVTLNPLAHLDPMGTIGMFLFGFGWGKPVMVNPGNFRNGRWDDIKVSAAGPAMNLVQAIFFGLVLRTLLQLNVMTVDDPGTTILYTGMVLNLGLMVFNLIPIGPLDGAHIMKGLLPLEAAYSFAQFNRQWGMLLMFGLIFSGYVGVFLRPVVVVFANIVFLPLG